MNLRENTLYHQIHPLKLLTNGSASVVSLYFLWEQQLLVGLAIHLIPGIVASILIVKFVNLERYSTTHLGRYVAKYMTGKMQLLRAVGDVITVIGAWFQIVLILVIGVGVIVLGWARGRLFP